MYYFQTMTNQLRNRIKEYHLKEDRHEHYARLLKASSLKLTALTEQVQQYPSDTCTGFSKLHARYMHLQGYVRYLRRKVDNTNTAS